jgi:peptidoglycan/LPS O-acetylase OafA/YrhL
MLVSVIAFIGLLKFTLRRRSEKPSTKKIYAVTGVVVIGGMILAKYGNNFGLPWWIYYTTPALLTLLLAPVSFRMNKSEVVPYLCLSFLVSPFIHVVFSFFIGWKEYMPFIPIPSIWELLQ